MTPSFIGRINNIPRCAAEHVLGFLADGFHFIRDFVDRNDGRLIDDNASPFGIYERVGCSQINGEIAGKEAKRGRKFMSCCETPSYVC
jgi:hypothetical protein